MAFSYSSIKTFDQCPRKYHRTRVAKDVVDVPGPEAQYGTDVHSVAECAIRDNKPVPKKYGFIEPVVGALKKLDGEKYCEMKFGVAKLSVGEFVPCNFYDNKAWMRCITDLLVVNGPKGVLIDYKTGKNPRYADVKQLDLMAGAAFVKFPQLQEIKSGLAFVVTGDLVKKTHVAEKQRAYLNVFRHELARLDEATATNNWPPNPGPLCPWCPVHDCEFWTARRGR